MRTRVNAALSAVVLAAAVAACSGGTTGKDAAAIVGALAAEGLPVKLSVTYDEKTDPNKLLGRPGGYTSKASFFDERVDGKVAGGKGDVGLGGGVEVFEDAAAAERRAEYIRRIAQAGPMFAEYDYVKANVVVRVSQQLTPGEAAEYDTVLAKILS